MSTSKKIIVVIGATGGQGGSIVEALLSDSKMSDLAIRSITRYATEDSLKKLASPSIEVVTVIIFQQLPLLYNY